MFWQPELAKERFACLLVAESPQARMKLGVAVCARQCFDLFLAGGVFGVP